MTTATKNREYECPRGTPDESFAPVLSSFSFAGRAVAPLSRGTLGQMSEVADEYGLVFEPVDYGTLATAAEVAGPKAVHGEPPITRQAYYTSAGANFPPMHRLVMHTTECACVSGAAKGVANYFAGSSCGGSAQYVTDPFYEAHCVKEAVIAWHAPPNQFSIGMEQTAFAAFTAEQWKQGDVQRMLMRAACRAADIIHRYSLPVVWLSPNDLLAGKRGETGHVNVSAAWHQSDHTDPGPNYPVKSFLSMVEHYLGHRPTPAPSPHHGPRPHPGKASKALVKGVQRAVHEKPVDGTWDHATDADAARIRDAHPASGPKEVRAVQRQLGLTVDGVWGPRTNGAVEHATQRVQKVLGVPQDASWGPKTQATFVVARQANYGK